MGKVDPKKIWDKLKWKRNVVGYSGKLKHKIRGGKTHRDRSMRMYVEHKAKDEAEVAALEQAGQLIPDEIDGVTTDIIQVGPMVAQGCEDTRKNLHRPAPAGVSAIYAGGTACTLGWFAIDNEDGELVIISNNHCTAKENKLQPGHLYVQPSPIDGTPVKLGELKRYVPIDFGRYTCFWRQMVARDFNPFYVSGVNVVDVGIISVDDVDVVKEILCIGDVNGKRQSVEGELLQKMGRTTGHTKDGLVFDNDYHGKIAYSRGKADFGPVGLVQKTGFSAGGDSSSAFIGQDDRFFVGLGFAGSGTHSLFCHMRDIESLANVSIAY